MSDSFFPVHGLISFFALFGVFGSTDHTLDWGRVEKLSKNDLSIYKTRIQLSIGVYYDSFCCHLYADTSAFSLSITQDIKNEWMRLHRRSSTSGEHTASVAWGQT